VRVIGYWTVERTPFIIEERMDLDLQKLIDKVNKLRPLEVIELLLPVAKVMWHLHDRGVAHRDLKPGNIMCTLQQNFSIACSPLQDITIKLIDLGEAAVENVSSFGGWRNVGTTEYKAPELFQEGTGAALDLLKADVFSFGVLLLKVLTRLTVRETGVFRQLGLKDYKNALKAGQRPSISHQVPDCLSRIIESCWAHEPRERPSFDVIYKTLLDSRHQLSTEVHENRKSFKTQWLDTVRNVKMHMSLHSMAHLILCFSRALVAPIVLILFLFFIWSCLRTTMPRQQGAHSLLPKCMNFENPSCAAVLDSLLTS
jgi:serine/threonine protein kinase